MEAKCIDVKGRRKDKKRAAADTYPSNEGNTANSVEILEADAHYDMSEPTMGEKLELLKLQEANETNDPPEREASPDIKLPIVDSVHVLLKQALNAEDHQLLLSCLNTRDEKVISNSVAELSPVCVLRLLNSLVSLTNSRGSTLVCALPWLRSLLVHHASVIMAQESSLSILNSLYQLIESRTSTFASALKLSTCLDFLFTGIVGDEVDEEGIPPPVIFEDEDTDEEESDGDMDVENQTELTDGDFPYESDSSDIMNQ